MVRPPCYTKPNVKRGASTDEEDVKILPYISKNGTGYSTSRKAESSSGTKRCGKSCRVRWSSYTKPDLKHEGFTQQEEELIIKLHSAVGSRWNMIAHQLPGRTDNEIKNHWNTKLKKKLTEMGIDPITHRPFSQILADYGNIGGIPRTVGAPKHIIKRDLKKNPALFIPQKAEPSFPPSYDFNSNTQISHNNHYPTLNQHVDHTNTSHSLDLLSQLQAINLVTQGANSNTNYDYFTHPSLNSSACSSSYNAEQAVMSPESLTWNDFLLDDDVFQPAPYPTQDQQGNYLTEFSKTNNIGSSFSATQSAEMPVTRSHVGSSSSSTSSDGSLFLETMLDQENDMFLNFPGLMEEPLY